MSLVKLPFFSGVVQGRFADKIYYRRNYGRTVACEKVSPSNPQTDLQQQNRRLIASLSTVWHFIAAYPNDVAAWELRRRYHQKNPSPYHEFMSTYRLDPCINNGFCFFRNVVFSSVFRQYLPGPPPAWYITFDISLEYRNSASTNARFAMGFSPFVEHNHVDWNLIGPLDWTPDGSAFSIKTSNDWLYCWFYTNPSPSSITSPSGLYFLKDIPEAS
jgi:hypothetical protein